MSRDYRRQMRGLTDLSSDVLDEIILELFSKFTVEQRNKLLFTATALVNRSAAGQFLLASIKILRNHPEALDLWCNTGREIGLIDIIVAKEYFKRSPEVLEEIGDEGIGPWSSLGMRIAEKSGKAAVGYFRESPQMLRTMTLSELIRWGQEGYRILEELNENAAIQYFALETRRSIELARPEPVALLEEHERVLKLYAEAISGREVEIQPATDSLRGDGRSLYLPIYLNIFGERESNFRLYRALTARLVGQIIYGTFELDLNEIKIGEMAARYGSKVDTRGRGFEAFFKLYPDPPLAREIFEILEDARIERKLRGDFRGIGKDLDLIKYTLARGSRLEEMAPLRAVLQVLLETIQLGASLPSDIPSWIADKVGQCMAIYGTAGDRVEDTAIVTDKIYGILESIESAKPIPPTSRQWAEAQGQGPGKGEEIRRHYDERMKSTGTVARGTGHRPTEPRKEKSASKFPRVKGIDISSMRSRAASVLQRVVTSTSQRIQGTRMSPPKGADAIESRNKGVGEVFRCDEWDYQIGDYRKGWCTVHETTVKTGSTRFIDNTLAAYSSLVSTVRREFQLFKPERLKAEKKQTDGDEMDLDAVVESYSEIKAGMPLIEERIYMRRNKIQRDVSVAFLIDLSGSTQGWIIDTEKKALVIMCEALEAIGDHYAIYGFSGASRNYVEFDVVKDFDEGYDDVVKGRIGHMGSLSQNRDGAAIRNAVRRLGGLDSKTKLLIIVSDGHPLDEIPGPNEPMYRGEYSIQDTRMALKEARIRGIRPFCITVDRGAGDYISTMYADVNYTIIDDVVKLPERMPAIYRRLTT